MKIAWFTPLDKRTGISRYSVSAVSALSKLADIDVWAPRAKETVSINGISVYEAVPNKESLRRLEGYDIVIYNMGNNIDFHFEIFEFYRRQKGIVILHDRIMHHFSAGYYLDKLKTPDRYTSAMAFYYGAEGRKRAERSLRYPPPVWETEAVTRYPLFEEFLWNASGIVVHSRELFEKTIKTTPITIRNIYHPFYQYPENRSYLSKEELRIPANRTILLQYGHITPNKNVHKVIDSISNMPEIINKIHFIIAGDHDSLYGYKIRSLIREKQLKNTISLTGHVSDQVLQSYLHHADVCINLRFPSSEGTSGSLIEQLYYKKPVIATDIGFYAEMPDDCIVKLPPPIQIDELSAAIKLMIKNKEQRDGIALRGNAFAVKNFSPDLYAQKVVEFIHDVLSSQVRISLIDEVSNEISRFVRPGTHEYFIDHISREIGSMSSWQPGQDEPDLRETVSPGNELLEHTGAGDDWDDRSMASSASFRDRCISFGWRHRSAINKVPLISSISKKLYLAYLKDN